MSEEDPETEALLRSADLGDADARARLLSRHRGQLRKMVAVRIDLHLAGLVDPSDIVREALADAGQKLEDYLRLRPLPFYSWLRRLAGERLLQLHRQHLQSGEIPLLDGSIWQLTERLATSGTTPTRHVIRGESRQQLRRALNSLAPDDREVLVMRYLERLPFGEIADVLGATEGAVKVLHFRALDRLRNLLEEECEWGGR